MTNPAKGITHIKNRRLNTAKIYASKVKTTKPTTVDKVYFSKIDSGETFKSLIIPKPSAVKITKLRAKNNKPKIIWINISILKLHKYQLRDYYKYDLIVTSLYLKNY